MRASQRYSGVCCDPFPRSTAPIPSEIRLAINEDLLYLGETIEGKDKQGLILGWSGIVFELLHAFYEDLTVSVLSLSFEIKCRAEFAFLLHVYLLNILIGVYLQLMYVHHHSMQIFDINT
jgi:hypothetical protein